MNRIKIIALSVVTVLFFTVCENPQGRVPSGEPVASGAEIRPASPLGTGRAGHTATRLNDGSVLIVGGMKRNGEFYDTAELFEPKSGSFKTLEARMIKKRVSHTATLLKNGTVLIVGGWSNTAGPESSTEIFDSKTGRFTAAASSRLPRSGHSASVLPNGDVLIAGGRLDNGATGSIEIFDVSTGSLSEVGTLVFPRTIHTATVLKDGNILFAGGQHESGGVTPTAEVFDVKKMTSRQLNVGLETARYKHDAVLLADGRVLVYGGSNARDRGGRFKSAEIYDPGKGRFERTGDLNVERFKISSSSVLLKDGRVLIAGGAERAELYDPSTGKFALVKGSFGEAYHFASATLLDDGRVLVLGGYAYGSASGPVSTSKAWLFTG